MTKQIKLDVLDVGFHLWTDDEKQHGYTNLTDLLDGLRGLLSDVPVEVDDGWIEWTPTGSALPVGLDGDAVVEYQVEHHPDTTFESHAGGLIWTESGGATITRYRVVRS